MEDQKRVRTTAWAIKRSLCANHLTGRDGSGHDSVSTFRGPVGLLRRD